MAFITIENLNKINFELTDYCNAACPMCSRHNWDGSLKNIVNKNHTTLEFIKERVGVDVIRQLKHILSCGTYGDAIMNPQCLEIYEFFRSNNDKKIELFTNGGARNTQFWKDLASLNLELTFSIDGLSDTNHLYRRNVKWDKLLENVRVFLGNGGKAIWEFLIFKHNEHQIEEARALSKKLGFKAFVPKHTGRWKDYDDDGEYRDTTVIQVDDYKLEMPDSQQQWQKVKNARPLEYFKDKEETRRSIECKSCSHNTYEIYIRANGFVSPCCWLGNVKIHEAKRLIDDFDSVSLHHTELKDILTGHFFKMLSVGIADTQSKHSLMTCLGACGVN